MLLNATQEMFVYLSVALRQPKSNFSFRRVDFLRVESRGCLNRAANNYMRIYLNGRSYPGNRELVTR